MTLSNVLRLKKSGPDRGYRPPANHPRVLLLQGPVGPFFKRLQNHLNQNGFDAWRICFNAGDTFFSNKSKRISYSRGLDSFPKWFEGILVNGEFDVIIYLGSDRALHSAAREIADNLGIGVLSLEEGYFRPGYVTVEKGGNNRTSPLAGKLPSADYTYRDRILPAAADGSFRKMVWYGFLYFVLRGLFTPPQKRKTFHKVRPLASEAYYWFRNYVRWFANARSNHEIVEHLLEKKDRKYFLLPLQVSDDTQLTVSGRGWNNEKFVSAALASFAHYAPSDMDLVIKIHPIERGHNSDRPDIFALASLYGVEKRVHVVDSGSLGLLCRHAAGMLTINSTSGLSAIAHGTPLFLIGDAVYRHPAICWCADDINELDRFWTKGSSGSEQLRQNYLAWLAEEAVVAGDFYAEGGIETAIHEIEKHVKAACEESGRRDSNLTVHVAAE